MPYTINGQPQNLAEPIAGDDTTYVPLAGVTETLGGYVTWDNYAKVAEVELNDKKVRVHEGSESVEVDGNTVAVGSASFLENSTLYVPIEFFQNVFLATVSADGDSIAISTV